MYAAILDTASPAGTAGFERTPERQKRGSVMGQKFIGNAADTGYPPCQTREKFID
jgi:hypothetical protein